jgi:ADP-sugar diphosphatase
MSKVTFRGEEIPVTAAGAMDIEGALQTDLFKGWLEHLDPSFVLKGIEFQSVDKFGTGRIGFIKFRASIERGGVRIPGIVLLRGPAVAVMLVITDESTGEEWTVLTEQPRVPTGRLLLEIPAGMADNDGNLKGVAIKELEEECGLVAKPDDLIDLVHLAYGDSQPGIYMSPGLCDESLRLFLWKTSMSHDRLVELEGKLGGEDAHEQIMLRLVKFGDAWKTAADAKSLSTLALYHYLKAEGKV